MKEKMIPRIIKLLIVELTFFIFISSCFSIHSSMYR